MSPPPVQTAQPQPRVAIRPSRGWRLPELREIWHFRDLLGTLAWRDVKIRYKQTALGVTWVVLQPLLAAGVFSFVFGSVAAMEAPGEVPYFLFSFTGLLAWNLFNGALGKSSASMVGNAHLVSKVYFPRLILPLSSVASAVIDFAVAAGMLLVLLSSFWHLPGVTLLALPLALLPLMLIALGLGFATTALAVRYRDVGYVLPVLLQVLMWGSPVAYAASEVPERYRGLYELNPLVGLLETFRWSVLGVGEFRWGPLLYAAAVSAVVFVVGALLFKRMERNFADVI